MKNKDIEHLYENTNQISAPVLISYIWWVLQEAEKIKLKKLYFLARDGYIMCKIATMLCDKYTISIDCEYLYCSRYSLRIPSFHLIGEEAHKLIFNGGYKITPNIVLCRAALNTEQRNAVYMDIGMPDIHEDTPLSKLSYVKFADKVAKSKIFNQCMTHISSAEFENTIGYLKQQGITNCENVGIVDTGWTGSMQRTLRQLLEGCGADPHITGFYFGMYEKHEDKKDGTYRTFYFNHKTNPFKVAKFNNNLLECICSAPHGMTMGYKKENAGYAPIFSDAPVNPLVVIQVEQIEQVCKKMIDSDVFPNKTDLYLKKLQKLMFCPTKEQADLFSEFNFCDDVCENYLNPLAQQASKTQIKAYTVATRIINKLFKRSLDDAEIDNLFWPYGSIALSDLPVKWYYRLNVLVWDVMRICLKYR